MLKHLKKVFVSFKPGDAEATAARELLQRVSGARARMSNPACQVGFKVDDEGAQGQSYVELHFNDGEQRKIMATDKTINDIQRIIEHKGTEMEMRAVFQEVGFDPWNQSNGSQSTAKR